MQFKVTFIGDSSVGKTSFLEQFVYHRFSQKYKATLGSDFYLKKLDIDGKTVTLQIWDTAGQERFRSREPIYYRGSDCIVFVYDVTNHDSFSNLKKWLDETKANFDLTDPNDLTFILLGNKIDLSNRTVIEEEAREYAQKNNMQFYEVSSKTGKT